MNQHTMNRRTMFTAVALALCLSVMANGAPKPNVVLVITDDQGYGDLSCHGNPVLKTPNLDQLYRESVRLADYHVTPTCSPTRGALQTGHWTNRTGVWHTIMGRSLLRENEVTMGQVFKDAGYVTAMFGKWHMGDNYPFRPEDRGYMEVMRHGGDSVENRVTFAVRSVLSREPTASELQSMASLYRTYRDEFLANTDSAEKLLSAGESKRDESLDPHDLAAWTMVAHLIFNLSETVTRG